MLRLRPLLAALFALGSLTLGSLTLAGCAGPAGPARTAAPPTPAAARAARPQPAEIRAVWLTNVDSDVLTSRRRIVEGLDTLQAWGFNVVFPVVWNKGYTLHPSSVMAATFGEGARQDTAYVRRAAPGEPPFDPLAAIVEEGHRRGFLVIPWFEFGFASSYQANGGHLLAAKPGWAEHDRDGKLLTKNGFEWMNALHPEVQSFMLSLVREVATRYDVDGIQGDDRLPAMPSSGGYSAFSRGLYAAEHGGAGPPADPLDPAFVAWKAAKLTAFGGRLYRTVKDVNPNLIVSLSPSVYPWSRDEYLQDWPAWIAAGQVDWLHPQNYRYEIARYRTTLDEVVAAHRGAPGHERVRLAPGVLVKAGPRYNGPAYVREALARHRALGLDGEVFFFYSGLGARNQNLGDSLRATFYRESPVR